MQIAALPYELLLQEIVHLSAKGLKGHRNIISSNDQNPQTLEISQCSSANIEASQHTSGKSSPDNKEASKLEEIGKEIGMRFSERFMSDRNGASFSEELEAIKCICRDLWPIINGYKFPIENLKTNHQGTYVLGWKAADATQRYVPNPIIVGIVVGFLSSLGIHVSATGYPGSLHLTRI